MRLAENSTSSRRWLPVAQAFTLIELLAVIVIMALIAAIGFPALKAMQGTALQTASRQFSNALILARQYSINMRKPVRVAIAVDSTRMGAASSNLICRAYSIYWASNDLNGATIAWWPLQDWRILPTGVVFSDHNLTTYSWVNLGANTVPPTGLNTRDLTATGGTAWRTFNNAGSTMPVITNIAVASSTNNITTSHIEFSPTGAARIPGLNSVAGVKLALGSVTIPGNRTIVLNNTSNWVAVEYDDRVGRVRVRTPESYQ